MHPWAFRTRLRRAAFGWKGSKLAAGRADAVSFARPYISNPDLPRRFSDNLPLAANDVETWYLGGAKGYIDYPPAA